MKVLGFKLWRKRVNYGTFLSGHEEEVTAFIVVAEVKKRETGSGIVSQD